MCKTFKVILWPIEVKLEENAHGFKIVVAGRHGNGISGNMRDASIAELDRHVARLTKGAHCTDELRANIVFNAVELFINSAHHFLAPQDLPAWRAKFPCLVDSHLRVTLNRHLKEA